MFVVLFLCKVWVVMTRLLNSQIISPDMVIFIQLKSDPRHWVNLRSLRLKLKINAI